MHLDRRDFSDYYGSTVPFFWRVAIGVFIAAVVVIIIRGILQAASAKRARQNAATSNDNPLYYNPQNYYQQSPMNTTSVPPRNQPQNPEDVIEPLPVYTPPNNNADKPPNYYNN
jgi:hypothetical protein